MKITRFLKFLYPAPPIGGLEIGEISARFILVKGSELTEAFVELPLGVIEEGRIKDHEGFKSVLLKLHSMINPNEKEKIYAVVNIPENNVYFQTFDIPAINDLDLEEAAKLNLQTISPIDFKEANYDWQMMSGGEKDNMEFLGAFIQNSLVSEYAQCLEETNFIVVAVETPSLAISRLIKRDKSIQEAVIIRTNISGLSFSFIKNGDLYFNHFVNWPNDKDKKIPRREFNDLIIRETQRVINYIDKRFPEAVKNFKLISLFLENEIIKIIKDNFDIDVQKLILLNEKGLSLYWLSAYGSALRGLIPRYEDSIISLIRPGTETEFKRQQIIIFAKIWRNIIFSALTFFVAVFILFDLFVVNENNKIKNSEFLGKMSDAESEELKNIQKEAIIFNSNIKIISEAKSKKSSNAPLFEKLKETAGPEIAMERISFQGFEKPILINAGASGENSIIDFKNKLKDELGAEDINLPLSNISALDGKLNFSVTFKLKKQE